MNTIQAAAALGITRTALMNLIHDGKIDAVFTDRHWQLHKDDVERFRVARLERQRKAFKELLELEAEMESEA